MNWDMNTRLTLIIMVLIRILMVEFLVQLDYIRIGRIP